MAKKKKMSKPACNIQLRWKFTKDQPAIKAIQDLADELGIDAIEALRWICVNTKIYALDKAKEIQKLLKAS